MANRLKDKVALITGGVKGIGLATARRFAEEGAKVVITDIDEKLSQNALDAVKGEAVFLKHDVTDEDDWIRVFKQTLQKFGKVDVVVNNAGIDDHTDVEHATYENWKRVIGVNLNGVFLGIKHGIISMKDHGGSIINISSIEGMIGDSELPSYDASKGGVRLLTKSAALYCAEQHYNIRINSVHPGYIHTPLIDNQPEVIKRVEKLHPLGRLGTPEEIANMNLFLASDESSFSTGSEFVADGGYTAQ